jgi:hypothetical protein
LHPEVDFIRAYCREIIGDKVYNPKIPDKIQVFGKEFFLQSGIMPGYNVSMFVRRDDIEKNNLRLSAVLDYKEDAEFIFRCVMNSDKILLYNKVFYNYFINDTSSSENLNLKKVTDHLTVAILMKKYSHFYDNLVVMKYVKHQLNHQLYLYFTEIRLIRDKSVVRAGKIRADILLFMRETNLKLSELSGLNLIFLFMGLIHIR